MYKDIEGVLELQGPLCGAHVWLGAGDRPQMTSCTGCQKDLAGLTADRLMRC